MVRLEFQSYSGRVLVGFDHGQRHRERFGLDEADLVGALVTVSIPDRVFGLTRSYFRGLFEKSVLACGSQEAFFQRFHFEVSPVMRGVVADFVSLILQDQRLALR